MFTKLTNISYLDWADYTKMNDRCTLDRPMDSVVHLPSVLLALNANLVKL